MRLQKANSRIILALDDLTLHEARQIANELRDHVAGGKVTDLIDRHGSTAMQEMGFKIRFLDAKIHDIKKTVANRSKAYFGNAEIVTYHASMSKGALCAAAQAGQNGNFLAAAVTVLTDINDECISIFGVDASNKVRNFAIRARDYGLHSIVCAAHENHLIKQAKFDGCIINPGVRTTGAKHHDQKRVATPTEALRSGADYIVCGREIMDEGTAAGRRAKVDLINEEAHAALTS